MCFEIRVSIWFHLVIQIILIHNPNPNPKNEKKHCVNMNFGMLFQLEQPWVRLPPPVPCAAWIACLERWLWWQQVGATLHVTDANAQHPLLGQAVLRQGNQQEGTPKTMSAHAFFFHFWEIWILKGYNLSS